MPPRAAAEIDRAGHHSPTISGIAFRREAAAHHTEIVAARGREGRPIEAFDDQIATMARVVELATRDVADFAGCGLVLVNPWRRHELDPRGLEPRIDDKTGACLLAHAGVLRGAAVCRYHQHKLRAHDPGQKPATPA